MARISYVGMSDDEISRTWQQEFLGQYTQHELDVIDRKWRVLGKRIINGDRIPDGKQGGKRK